MFQMISESVLLRLTVFVTIILIMENGIKVCEGARKKSRPPLIETPSMNKHHNQDRLLSE